MWVSILVLVDVGLRLLLFEFCVPPFKVSILVLVDVGLRQVESAGLGINETCFNPCFSGCWSSTHIFR